jgi:hypothetical protein
MIPTTASFTVLASNRLEHHWRTQLKIMAIGTLNSFTPEQQRTYMPTEVPATLKLYLDGKMEQFWLRDNNAGVIFLMTVDSVKEAEALLKAMPLGAAGLLTFELMPVGPLAPLAMLMPPPGGRMAVA